MNGLISVIVPVYNVAAYLPECMESILSQDHTNLEVILIDDGSTDASGAICDEYAKKDSRIRVIHQKNAGAAAAKNAGLRAVSGEYLSFVDSDDFLEPGAYSHMLQLLQEHQADAVQCAFRDVFRNRRTDRCVDRECGGVSGKEYLARYTRDWTCALLWDKLYRRALFDGIFFEEGHRIDDEYFTYQGIMNARKVYCDNWVVYNYRKRGSSVMCSPQSGARILRDRVDSLSKRRVKVGSRFPELKKLFDEHFLEAMILLSRDANGTPESIELIQDRLKAYFREKGHTVPRAALWPTLLKLRFGSIDRLLAQKAPSGAAPDPDEYFE